MWSPNPDGCGYSTTEAGLRDAAKAARDRPDIITASSRACGFLRRPNVQEGCFSLYFFRHRTAGHQLRHYVVEGLSGLQGARYATVTTGLKSLNMVA